MPALSGRTLAVAAFALLVTGCGATKHLDRGGFTASDRRAAQAALDVLRRTAVPRRVLAISTRADQAPSTCVVTPVSGRPGAFALVVAWARPRAELRSVPQSVIEATIDGPSARDVSFRESSFGAGAPEPTRIRAVLARAALASPAEPCVALDDGSLQLASGG